MALRSTERYLLRRWLPLAAERKETMPTHNSTATPVPSGREVLPNTTARAGAGDLGRPSRLLIALLTATVSLAPTAGLLAQHSAQTGARTSGTARTRATDHNTDRSSRRETAMTSKEAKMTATVTQLDTAKPDTATD